MRIYSINPYALPTPSYYYGDGSIVIRMFGYAVLIALENVQTENGTKRIELPKACVLYLRGKADKKEEALQVVFPDGQELLDQGRAEGMERGMERRNKEIALKMLKRDMPDEDIMDMTGISEKELQAIKEMLFATA